MKKITILLLLLMLIGIAAADVYTIGDGTSTQSYIPFYGFYDYGWSKVIYTAAELSAAGMTAGQIDGIGFDVGNTPSNYVSVDQRVYMRHTTATAIDNTYPDNTEFQNVFYDDYTWNGSGWHYIMFSTPFSWDGASNIEILWENWDGDYESGPSFRYTSTSPDYLAAYKYDDGSFPAVTGISYYNRPNIQIVTPQLDPPDPAILVSPTDASVSFTDTNLIWSSGGGMPTSYNVYFGNTNPPNFEINQTSTSYALSNLDPGTTYYWQIVPENANGTAENCPIWSFSTPTDDQLAESFEVSVPPAGWASLGTANWTRSTTVATHGSASAYKYASSSSQFTLSTPMLDIEAGDMISFDLRVSNVSAALELVYSTDRENWILLDEFNVDATNTWQSFSADLTDAAGGHYIGFRTAQVAASFYLDSVIGPEILPVAPGVPSLSAPADLAENISEYATLNWNAPTVGGIPDGYNLYLDTVDGSTLFASNVMPPYSLDTPLDYLTTYYWTVEAFNGAGTSDQAEARSFTTRDNPVISTFPWTEDFGTETTDWMPLNWSQASGIFPVIDGTLTQWIRGNWLNLGAGNNAARINIYGTGRKGWLITPPIDIPANGYELRFDLGLTRYAQTNPIEDPTSQLDDKFIVAMATNPGMTDAVILGEWNNTGSALVYNEIPHTGTNVSFTLDGITGIRYFAFYGESTVTGGDNDLFVDNVNVREIPASPIISVTPDAWSYGTSLINTVNSKQFTISNTGAGSLDVSSINVTGTGFALAEAFSPMSLLTNESASFTVNFTPTTEDTYSGNIAINDNRAVTNIPLTGEALDATIYAGDLPHLEDFDGDWTGNPAAPFGWTVINANDDSYYWSQANTYISPTHSGTYAAHGMGNTNDYLITPPIDLSDTNARISWWDKVESASYPNSYKVLLSTTDTQIQSFAVELGDFTCTNTVWTEHTINLDAYNGQTVYIAFFQYASAATYWGFGIDDVLIEEMPESPILSLDPDVETWDFGVTQINTVASKEFTITNIGAGTLSIEDIEVTGDYFALAEELEGRIELTNGQSTAFTVNYGPLVAGSHTGRIMITDGRELTVIDLEGTGFDSTVTSFPWLENFDAALTPPIGWIVADLDGGGSSWVGSTAQSNSAPNSFFHNYSSAIPDPGQDGWLITPPIEIPSEGVYAFSWMNYNSFPTWIVYNGLKVNTTNDPTDPNWVELWTAEDPASSWSSETIVLDDYIGQTVYFAFVYQGYDADGWYIDDVGVFELTEDTIPPTITHLPLLNTPITDAPYNVVAEILDDAIWNNSITDANLYYSIDFGVTYSQAIPMTYSETEMVYQASIPAQELATTVLYYMDAADSEGNTTITDPYEFVVSNPTMLHYDQGGTTYRGFAVDFGPTVIYDNPFYGTGRPMQLLATYGSSYYSTTADLVIYVPGAEALEAIYTQPVSFGAQTFETFDLTAQNIVVNAPYFVVAYENVPADNYFLFDDTYDYGTTRVKIDGTYYTLSSPGSWAIRAMITDWEVPSPVVSIETNDLGQIVLSWDPVLTGESYKVMGAADPFAETWTELTHSDATSFTYTGDAEMHFFRVIAMTDDASRAVSSPVYHIDAARSIKAELGPKPLINTRR